MSRWSHPPPIRIAKAALLLITALPAMTVAQEPTPSQDRFLVLGVVLDHRTDQPIAGARVHLTEMGREVRTNERGEFHLPDVPGGEHTVVTHHWGYLENEETSSVRQNVVLMVRLQPNPVLLEAIEVSVERANVTERITQRSRRIGFSVRSVDRERLLLTSAANPMQLLQDRFGIGWVPCPGDEPGERNCLMTRGRPAPPRVFIDDVRVPGGMAVLEFYPPHTLERLEYFPLPLNHLRVYTPHYVD